MIEAYGRMSGKKLTSTVQHTGSDKEPVSFDLTPHHSTLFAVYTDYTAALCVTQDKIIN